MPVDPINVAADCSLEISVANGRSPFNIYPKNGVRMLIIIADPANVDGAEVTYTGTGKWFEYDENGVSTGNSFSSDPVPIPKGSFLALPTDGLTVMRGVITTPASSKAYIITKT
jgi:hypothetical protein